MDCGVCMVFLRKKRRCAGCNVESPRKSNHCSVCKIRNCPERAEGSGFCFDCRKYPCVRLKQLDKRYRAKYSMSMIENLNGIRDSGLERFMESENSRWACPTCGNPVCVHNGKCYHCQRVAGNVI